VSTGSILKLMALSTIVGFSMVACSGTRPVLIQNHEHGLASRAIESVESYTKRDSNGRLQLAHPPMQCRPYSVPVRAMIREKVFSVDGLVDGRIAANGVLEFVGLRGDIPESLRTDLTELWRESFTAPPCKIQPSVELGQFEFPFRFVLEN